MATVRANRPDVVDEEFDGEAVLVNLRTGRYHALDPVATGVWRAIGTDSVPVARLVERAGASDRAVAVLHALAAEALIVVDGDLPADPGGATGLESFADMEDLLLLDPIHDVDLDGTGWPVRADEPA